MRLHILVFLSQLSFSNPLLWLSPFTCPIGAHICTSTHTQNLFSICRDLFLYLPKDIDLYRFKSLLWSKIEGQQQALLHSEMDLTERLLKGQDLLGRLVLKLSPSLH